MRLEPSFLQKVQVGSNSWHTSNVRRHHSARGSRSASLYIFPTANHTETVGRDAGVTARRMSMARRSFLQSRRGCALSIVAIPNGVETTDNLLQMVDADGSTREVGPGQDAFNRARRPARQASSPAIRCRCRRRRVLHESPASYSGRATRPCWNPGSPSRVSWRHSSMARSRCRI